MQRITLDAMAGQLSADLACHDIAADARVHVLIEVMDNKANALPIAATVKAGGAFDWLTDEPGLYSDADLVKPRVG